MVKRAMCSQFEIKATPEEIADFLELEFPNPGSWEAKVFPYYPAPVATKDGIRLMQFSLVPAWSREPKVKFPTYNARLDTITEKPTWKKPFTQGHCVVPITRFIEPTYTGRLAGHMIAFSAPNILLAAGIYDRWRNPKTGEELLSFAIVTDDPSDFVKDLGHDRQPVFLDEESARDWLSNENEAGEQLKIFLREMALEPNFSAQAERSLARGWEKRAPKEDRPVQSR